MRTNQRKFHQAGFSLVEMLVVVAVIGIIAAIALPNIGRINESANDSNYRRNAQTIASVFASAQASGLNFGEGKTTEAEVIEAVMAGGTVSEGTFAGAVFKVPGDVGAATDDVSGAAKYLSWDSDSDLLLYIATGGTTDPE